MMRNLQRAAGLGVAVSALLAVALPAAAQTAGVYSGTAADGTGISLTVGNDGGGAVAVISAGVGITATCLPGGSTFSTGWGYGTDGVIAGNKFSYVESFGYLYETVSGTFSGNTITGKIASYVPTFAPVKKGAPKKAVFCSAPSQSFTAVLGAPAKALPAGSVFTGASK